MIHILRTHLAQPCLLEKNGKCNHKGSPCSKKSQIIDSQHHSESQPHLPNQPSEQCGSMNAVSRQLEESRRFASKSSGALEGKRQLLAGPGMCSHYSRACRKQHSVTSGALVTVTELPPEL